MSNLRSIYLCIAVIQFSLTTLPAQYSLPQTLGAPYVQSVHAAEDGQSLAWVVNEQGVRNIWYRELNNGESQQLTNYDQDNGLNLSQVRLSAGYMLYVRGNGNNRYGQPANPASLPGTPKRVLLRMRLSDQKTDTIAEAANPILAPDGKGLLYTKGSEVYFVEDITTEKPAARRLFAVRSGVGSLRWSPDGRAIAFVSNRGDHSFVGYYSMADNQLRWMAPSFSFDELPVWSPDGRQIAFLRRPGYSKDELRNLTGGFPFKIVVADVATETGTTIWKSPADDGGFAQYYPNDPLRWTRNNKILFHSEHEDWNHLYALNPDGTGLTDLTPGKCEVENSTLSRDHRFLYVSTNCTDINRRHIWKANIETGTSEMITEASGIQTHPVALADEVLAYREGTHNRPTSVVVQRGTERQNLIDLPASFPQAQLVEPQAVQFKAADGLTIHGQLFLPPDASTNRLPAVIFMHGGPIRQMLLGYHYSGYYANAYVLNQYLAAQGYAVLSVNFRDGIGYGRDFRRAANQGPRGASEYKDIIAAGKYLQAHPRVDPERIGLWGGSYGGYLTAMGLAKNSDLFKAGVDFHGVHDWAWRARDFSPGGGWGITKELMEEAYQSSPVAELQFWSSPVLIISGDDDRNVMFGQSIDLKNKLDALGVHNEALVFPDEVHGFLRYASWLKAYERTVDFFDRWLK